MFKRLKNFVNNSIYKNEFGLAIATFIINLPPLLLVIMEYFKPCSSFWLILMYAMVPPYVFGYILTGVFNLSSLLSKFPVFAFCIFQLVLNTIALIKILIIKRQRDKDFWFCLLFIIINFVIMFIFNILYLNMPSWCNLQ